MKKTILTLALLSSFGASLAQNDFQLDASYVLADSDELSSTTDLLRALPTDDASILEEASLESSDLDENIEYLEEVQSAGTPRAIQDVQLMASLYDVDETYLFDGRNEPFQIIFETEKGTIRTTYDWKGEVLTSEEKFIDVSVPSITLRKALKGHEGWKVLRTNYEVSYVKDQKAEKIYTLQITDGKKKKKITVNAEGMVL